MKPKNSTVVKEEQAKANAVTQSPEFINAMVKMGSDPAAHTAAQADIKAFLQNQGVALPPDAKVTYKADRGTWTVCLILVVVSVCHTWQS